jgi:hypothetical protein
VWAPSLVSPSAQTAHFRTRRSTLALCASSETAAVKAALEAFSALKVCVRCHTRLIDHNFAPPQDHAACGPSDLDQTSPFAWASDESLLEAGVSRASLGSPGTTINE